ncbi:MAG: cysteine desulfurase [bacterium]|nr:cysteine desulfurase [bacterium]
MDIDKIRQDFPLLRNNFHGRKIVYFDNACQSLRPQAVIGAISNYYASMSACAGRSAHRLGELVNLKCDEARKLTAKFIGARKKEEIIFTRNTTEGINLVAHSLNLKKDDIVLTSDKEHNSNLIPWQILVKKSGIKHIVLPSRSDNTFNEEVFKKTLSDFPGRIKLVSLVHSSNLDGVTIPAKEIIRMSHQVGAKALLDAAQSASHQKINVADLDVDFLAFSGHKMLGPSGIGVLYGKYKLLENLEPFLVGGDTVEYSTYEDHKLLPPPEKFEAGLQDYAGIIGLAEALKYIEKVGWNNIAEQEYKLKKFVSAELKKIPLLKIIGPADPQMRSGIVTFYIDGKQSHEIALLLDQTANIMVRSGQFCVHSWFNAQHIKDAVRISFSFYNTAEEAKFFIETLNKIIKIL